MAAESSDIPMHQKQSDRFHYDQIRDHSLIWKAGSSLEVFESVLDAINSRHFEVITSSLLKKLYHLLVYLSCDSCSGCSNFGGSNCLGIRNQEFNYTLKFTDICDLSHYFFNELSRRIEQLIPGLYGVPIKEGFKRSSQHSNTWEQPQQDLTLLLRCCMVMLHLIEFDQNLLSERCGTLLTILHRLCSQDLLMHISRLKGTRTSSTVFERSVSCERKYVSDGDISVEKCVAFMQCLEQSNLPASFPCSILEVFVDELLVHRNLRQCFVVIDTVSCCAEKLFMFHTIPGDIDIAFEVISAHFLLVVSDEQAFKGFLETLFWQYGQESPSLELSPTAAVHLLWNPVMLSAPQVLQAYVISLVSRSIAVDMVSQDQRVDPRVMNIYVSAFERSMILYTTHMSSLQLDDHLVRSDGESLSCDKPCTSGRGFCPPFECCVRPVTYKSISLKLSTFSESQQKSFSKTKSVLLSASIAYMKENEHVLEKSNRDQILSVLNCIISWTISGKLDGIASHRSGDVNQQEMYLLASIIKLMSGSLLQIICLMQGGGLGSLKNLKDYSCCKEYNFIIGTISCFGQHNVSQANHSVFCEVMGATCHKESKVMLMHFAHLLLFSIDQGHESLWKSCIFIMMTLMNLIIFEDGNLEALKPFAGSMEEPLSSQSATGLSKVVVTRSSSFAIASKFRKIQTLNFLRTSGILLIKDVEDRDDTCNGKGLLKLLVGKQKKPHDFDDLADFIECKREKNYSIWLKDKEKFRRFKNKKRLLGKARRKCNLIRKLPD